MGSIVSIYGIVRIGGETPSRYTKYVRNDVIMKLNHLTVTDVTANMNLVRK
jgi:hypothetical protein